MFTMMKNDNENKNVTNCTVTSESTTPICEINGNDDVSAISQQTGSGRVSYRQRKTQLEEYCKTFLHDTRIADRKPVFVSGEVRDRLDRIVRLFGGRKMSVSGMLENIARHHIDTHDDDIEAWRKM